MSKKYAALASRACSITTAKEILDEGLKNLKLLYEESVCEYYF